MADGHPTKPASSLPLIAMNTTGRIRFHRTSRGRRLSVKIAASAKVEGLVAQHLAMAFGPRDLIHHRRDDSRGDVVSGHRRLPSSGPGMWPPPISCSL